MAKCMKCGGSKKMGYMDLGGNFVDMTNQYNAVEPTSGYGTMSSDMSSDMYDRGKGKKSAGTRHAADVRRRQQKSTRNLKRNIGNCRRGANGQMICN